MDKARAIGTIRTMVAPAALSALSGVGLWLVYLVTVRTAPGRQFGDASLRGAILTNSGVADAVNTVLRVVSAATLLAGVTAIALTALVRLRRVLGLVGVGLVVGANATTWLLKNHLLSRPDLGLREVTPATLNSLPSGHTTAVFSVGVALLLILPSRWRHGAAIAAGVGGVVTALAAMSAGWHRAGDSIAAFLVVGIWAGLAATASVLFDEVAREPTADAPAAPRSRRWLVAMTVGSFAVGLVVALGLVAAKPLRTSTAGAVSAFLAGGLLIVASAIAVLVAVLVVVDRLEPESRPTA